jgi:hypothetical protein
MPVLAALLLLLVFPADKRASPPDLFAPIALYQGTWQVTPSFSGTGTDTLRNDCREFTESYACQQTVNGHVGALIVFAYAGTPGHYHTQPIQPSGAALGRGDLTINASQWTFSGKDTQDGKTTYFRTTNDFHGSDQIHFEVSHSTDGKTWIVDHKGDEHRTSDR